MACRTFVRAIVVLLLPGFLNAPLAAQADADVLVIGQPFESRIEQSAPRLSDSPFRAFRFDAAGGEQYRITMQSPDFEPFLRVGQDVGGVTDYIHQGGNHGLDAGAVLLFTPRETASYLIIAQGVAGGTGSFILEVESLAGESVLPLALDVPTLGVVLGESTHSFEGVAGEEVEITVRSDDFDTVLDVGQSAIGGFSTLATDDDGGGETDSKLYFIPPADGEYLVRIRDYADGPGGGYAIVLTKPVVRPAPGRFEVGTPAEGRITDENPTNDEGIPFAEWVFSSEAGTRYRIELNSMDFDAYLSVGHLEGSRFVETASNDDAGGANLNSTDSRLILNATTGGDQVIRVRPFSASERGDYAVVARALPPPPAEAAGGTIEIGGSVSGALADTDALLPSGVSYQEWTFNAEAGQRFDIVLASEDFDANLAVGRSSGPNMAELAANDDGFGTARTTDSRLVFTAREAGGHIVRVTSFGAGETGRYTLSLSVAPPPPVVDRNLFSGVGVEDVLDVFDSRLEDGTLFHDWRFAAEANRAYDISLSSDDFDAFLAIGIMNGGTFAEIRSNDDFGDGTDARLTFTPTANGEYIVRVRPYFSGEFGAYSISVGP